MPKIVCFDKQYNVQHTFDTLDELLEEIKGSKTQAEKALNDVSLNFRGFKLIEVDKIPSIFSELLKEREENLRNEYGSNIEDLEKQIKDLTKKERQAKFKVDELEDNYSQKYAEYTDEHAKEKQALLAKHENEKSSISKDFNQKLESLVAEREKTVKNLTSQAHNNEKELIDAYKKQAESFEKAFKEYQQVVADKQKEHEESINALDKAYVERVTLFVTNLEHLTDYLDSSRNKLIAQVEKLTGIFNTIIENDIKVYALEDSEKVTLDIPKDLPYSDVENTTLSYQSIPKVESKDYLPKPTKDVDYDVVTIKDKPSALDVDKGLDISPVEVKDVSVEVTTKPEPKKAVVEPKEEPVSKPVEESPVVKGFTLKNPSAYKRMYEDVKGLYLSDLASKGLAYADLKPMTKDESGLSSKVAAVFLSEVISRGLKYSSCKDYLVNVDALKVISDLNLTKEEVDTFLEIEEPVKTEETTPEPSKEVKPETNSINFNWEKYVDVISRNVDMEELLDQDMLPIRDLQRIISVPSKQILSMVGVMRKLGYEKEFSNERVISRLESIFLIAVASSHTSQKGKASLEDLITGLYPSWISYVNKNKK